jgi:hypothetical protein
MKLRASGGDHDALSPLFRPARRVLAAGRVWGLTRRSGQDAGRRRGSA